MRTTGVAASGFRLPKESAERMLRGGEMHASVPRSNRIACIEDVHAADLLMTPGSR